MQKYSTQWIKGWFEELKEFWFKTAKRALFALLTVNLCLLLFMGACFILFILLKKSKKTFSALIFYFFVAYLSNNLATNKTQFWRNWMLSVYHYVGFIYVLRSAMEYYVNPLLVLNPLLLIAIVTLSLHEKYPYSALFFPVWSRIWAEYGEIPRMSLKFSLNAGKYGPE